ncbi:MAG TPA: hypothetical protein VGM75_16635 [Pseudonocardiaceae bacterium]
MRLWLLVLLALACVGCGVRPSGVIGGNPAPTGPVNGVTLFLVQDGQLVPILRTTTTQLTPTEAVTVLAAGPSSAEKAQTLRTQVPTDIAPINVTTTPSGTTIDVAIDPNSLSTVAVEQLVCTAVSAMTEQPSAPGSPSFSITGAGRTIGSLVCRETG